MKMSFELLGVPDGFHTDRALVIAPYVDPKFMKELVKRMKPRRLCLLVDDGVRLEDLDKIRRSCRQHVDLEVRLGRAVALVHMKAFYFEFVRETPRRRRRQLLFGSANATAAAFDGNRNAELIADTELAIGDDAELANYFEEVLSAFDTDSPVEIDARDIDLSRAPTLHLPRFRTSVPGVGPSGFDSWLQRGVLAAQYRNAPQFLTLSIQLKKRLPQDLVAQIFSGRRFSERGNRNVVRYPYLGEIEDPSIDEAEDGSSLRWRSRFGVWTHLGEWIADDCYRAHRGVMKSQTWKTRRDRVDELLSYAEDEAWQGERRTAFLSALAEVWDDLSRASIAPDEYLVSENGGLAVGDYGNRFDLKLATDILLAQDEDFRNRYINGYEFPDVPRFRQDTAAWSNFVRSWCESIAVEAAKSRTLSAVARRIGDVCEYEGNTLASMSPAEIERLLREQWGQEWDQEEGSTIGDWIGNYYRD